MLLFKKILNFKGAGGLGDKRGATRYPVGTKYPLKAKVTLVGRDGEGNVLKTDDNRAMDWGGQLVNMSAGGVSMRLHPAAMGERGENCRLKLELDHRLFEIDGTLAHFWSGPQHATVGIALVFPDSHTQKAFRQLVEPVALGCALAPVEKVKQEALLHDFRDHDHVFALRGCVAQRIGDGEPGLRDIGGPDVVQWKRVRRWLDAGDIDLGELLDVAEHTAELRGKTGFLIGRERETRQFRDAVDVKIGGLRHGYLRMT